MSKQKIEILNKYTFYKKGPTLYCLRYGEEWRDFIGDKAVTALFDELTDLSAELERKDQELKKFNDYVGSNMIRSDFRTVDDMRAELERVLGEVEALKQERKALKAQVHGLDELLTSTNALKQAGVDDEEEDDWLYDDNRSPFST